MKNYSFEEKIQQAMTAQDAAEQQALATGKDANFAATAGIRAYEKSVKDYTLRHIAKVDVNKCLPSDVLCFLEDMDKNVSVPHFDDNAVTTAMLDTVHRSFEIIGNYRADKEADGFSADEIKAMGKIIGFAVKLQKKLDVLNHTDSRNVIRQLENIGRELKADYAKAALSENKPDRAKPNGKAKEKKTTEDTPSVTLDDIRLVQDYAKANRIKYNLNILQDLLPQARAWAAQRAEKNGKESAKEVLAEPKERQTEIQPQKKEPPATEVQTPASVNPAPTVKRVTFSQGSKREEKILTVSPRRSVPTKEITHYNTDEIDAIIAEMRGTIVSSIAERRRREDNINRIRREHANQAMKIPGFALNKLPADDLIRLSQGLDIKRNFSREPALEPAGMSETDFKSARGRILRECFDRLERAHTSEDKDELSGLNNLCTMLEEAKSSLPRDVQGKLEEYRKTLNQKLNPPTADEENTTPRAEENIFIADEEIVFHEASEEERAAIAALSEQRPVEEPQPVMNTENTAEPETEIIPAVENVSAETTAEADEPIIQTKPEDEFNAVDEAEENNDEAVIATAENETPVTENEAETPEDESEPVELNENETEDNTTENTADKPAEKEENTELPAVAAGLEKTFARHQVTAERINEEAQPLCYHLYDSKEHQEAQIADGKVTITSATSVDLESEEFKHFVLLAKSARQAGFKALNMGELDLNQEEDRRFAANMVLAAAVEGMQLHNAPDLKLIEDVNPKIKFLREKREQNAKVNAARKELLAARKSGDEAIISVNEEAFQQAVGKALQYQIEQGSIDANKENNPAERLARVKNIIDNKDKPRQTQNDKGETTMESPEQTDRRRQNPSYAALQAFYAERSKPTKS